MYFQVPLDRPKLVSVWIGDLLLVMMLPHHNWNVPGIKTSGTRNKTITIRFGYMVNMEYANEIVL